MKNSYKKVIIERGKNAIPLIILLLLLICIIIMMLFYDKTNVIIGITTGLITGITVYVITNKREWKIECSNQELKLINYSIKFVKNFKSIYIINRKNEKFKEIKNEYSKFVKCIDSLNFKKDNKYVNYNKENIYCKFNNINRKRDYKKWITNNKIDNIWFDKIIKELKNMQEEQKIKIYVQKSSCF